PRGPSGEAGPFSDPHGQAGRASSHRGLPDRAGTACPTTGHDREARRCRGSRSLRVACGNGLGPRLAEGSIEMSEQEKDWTVAERFGANLTWLRCKASVSQQELADLTEMHRAQVAALERGGRIPRLDTILKLAAGIGVSACQLIAWIWWDPASH